MREAGRRGVTSRAGHLTQYSSKCVEFVVCSCSSLPTQQYHQSLTIVPALSTNNQGTFINRMACAIRNIHRNSPRQRGTPHQVPSRHVGEFVRDDAMKGMYGDRTWPGWRAVRHMVFQVWSPPIPSNVNKQSRTLRACNHFSFHCEGSARPC